jgi:LysM repeat protein
LVARVICIVLLLSLFGVVVFSGQGQSSAGHTSYTVEPYETLWTIAETHYGGDPREAVYRIEQANHLADATIHAGQILDLP